MLNSQKLRDMKLKLLLPFISRQFSILVRLMIELSMFARITTELVRVTVGGSRNKANQII